jgi:ribosome biogenesis GTPase
MLAGDIVEFDEKECVISSIKKRKNSLIRPSIANIDLINIVISNPPAPDLILVDKLICSARIKGIDFFITVNKADLNNIDLQNIINSYKKICKIFVVSALTGENIEQLKDYIKGRLVCFAGQSAVGKTSLINRILGIDNKTGEVSLKTERGKHTTTVTELITKDNFFVADTPGFSTLFNDISQTELSDIFFQGETEYLCKFRGCLHLKEPDCAIKNMVESGEINKKRYERYLQILNELIEKDKRRKNYA